MNPFTPPHFPQIPRSNPLPIIEDPQPFDRVCNHKVLTLKNQEAYTYITRFRKVYTCVDCAQRFTIQPEGMKMYHPLMIPHINTDPKITEI